MRTTLSNGAEVHYIEGWHKENGTKRTTCTGRYNGIYFRLVVPETGPEAIRKLRSAVEGLADYSQRI